MSNAVSVQPHLIRQAAEEIRSLRRQNELLNAKVDVMEIFRAALLGPPVRGGMSPPDVLWALDEVLALAYVDEWASASKLDAADGPRT